jgi:hypothetical protein
MILLKRQLENLIQEAQDALQFQSMMSAKEANYWITQEAKAKFKLKKLAKQW